MAGTPATGKKVHGRKAREASHHGQRSNTKAKGLVGLLVLSMLCQVMQSIGNVRANRGANMHGTSTMPSNACNAAYHGNGVSDPACQKTGPALMQLRSRDHQMGKRIGKSNLLKKTSLPSKKKVQLQESLGDNHEATIEHRKKLEAAEKSKKEGCAG